MKSEDFPFEGAVLEALEGDIRRCEISHSYLFWGPNGIGKAELAERFAAAVNCTGSRSGPLGYCGACSSCSKMRDEVLVDYNVRRPTRAVRRERGADVKSSRASIKIEDVRDMIEDIYIKPNEAKRKFWVLEDVHTMEERMLNSLLKVLEEPPGDSVVVLTAESPDDLLPTVTSRCRQVKLQRPQCEDVAAWLSDKCGVDGKRAAGLARAAGCLPGRARAMAADPGFDMLRKALFDGLVKATMEKGPFAAQRAADGIQGIAALALDEGLPGSGGPADPDSESGQLASPGGIMDFIATFLRDLAFAGLGYPVEALANADRIPDIIEAAGRAPGAVWLKRAERAGKLAIAVRASANFRLALDEAAFMAAGCHN